MTQSTSAASPALDTLRAKVGSLHTARSSVSEATGGGPCGFEPKVIVHAERVETTDAFKSAFGRACAAERSAVLELVTDPGQIAPDRRLSARAAAGGMTGAT